MKIISKQKDYYDSVQGVMYDSDITYIRSEKIYKSKNRFPYLGLKSFSNLILIGFCDKIIPLIEIKNVSYQISSDFLKIIKIKDINLHKLGKNLFPDTYISYDMYQALDLCGNRGGYYNIDRDIKIRISNIDSLIKTYESMNLFNEYETPIFAISPTDDGSEIKTGCLLKDYNFQSVMDPYTAYQELVMWLGNKAVNTYPPKIVDDIVLRDSKGFDKWSFKNKPGYRKKRGK
jgi:hypothetical protein